jgi:predicted  nucleic acid-binding Zn-ribbon protein
MSSSEDLTYHLQTLYFIEKQLGGRTGELDQKKKGQDPFFTLKDAIMQDIHKIREQQKELEGKLTRSGGQKTHETIRLKRELEDLIKDTQDSINKLNDTYRKQIKKPKKHTKIELEQKQKCFDKINEVFASVKEDAGIESKAKEEKVQTLTDKRTELFMKGERTGPVNEQAPTAEEEEVMERWKKRDQEIDAELAKVNQGLDEWKSKMEMVNIGIETTGKLIVEVDTEVQKTNKQIVSANAKLKETLTKFRAPSKFLFDIILVLFLLGLVGVIVQVVL